MVLFEDSNLSANCDCVGQSKHKNNGTGLPLPLSLSQYVHHSYNTVHNQIIIQLWLDSCVNTLCM